MACLAVGVGVGFIGAALSGNAYWYLAIPVAVATGWWFVADPTQCGCAGTPAAPPAAGDPEARARARSRRTQR